MKTLTYATTSEDQARHEVFVRSGNRCEICGQPNPESYAHRRSRGQGGGWAPWNALRLCGDGVQGCHGWTEAHPWFADVAGWRIVHRDPDPMDVPVWLAPHGWSRLVDPGDGGPHVVERVYPEDYPVPHVVVPWSPVLPAVPVLPPWARP